MNRHRWDRKFYQLLRQQIWSIVSNASKRSLRKVVLVSLLMMTLVSAIAQPAISSRVTRQTPFHAAVQPSLTTPSPVAKAQFESSQLTQGQRQYDTGQLSAALHTWQQAAADSQLPPLARALSWSYASIAAQDLGDWATATDAINSSLALLANLTTGQGTTLTNAEVKAQVLNTQGRLHLKKGQPEAAWETWQEAAQVYREADDELGNIGAQINQSQALQTMGLYRRAKLLLEKIAEKLQDQPQSEIKAIALKSLGTVFQTAGSLEQSKQYLNESLSIYRQIGRDADIADTLFALGNTARLMQDYEAAQQYYQAVEVRLPSSVLSTQAQLNRFTLLLKAQDWMQAKVLLDGLVAQITALPASRQAIYSRVNLVDSLLSASTPSESALSERASAEETQTSQPIQWLPMPTVARLLTDGAQQAQALKDTRAQALATGELSKLYSYTQQWGEVEQLSQQAIALSQSNSAQDMTYRWHRQLGKAYQQQGKGEKAIASYTAAVDSLGSIRRDLLATNADVQYSFRESVEPVYRELVSLLLLPEEASQSALAQARATVEELQLAEMENYFRSACIDSKSEFIDRLDPEAAVLYPIVLADRVEVIASLPESPLQHYRTWQTQQTTDQTIQNLYRYFNPAFPDSRRLNLSQEVYSWLITPIEETLSNHNISTLVFVLDGQFRKIPMSALYDGEHYLLENYAIALTPGMKLLGPHFQNPKPLQALMLGLTQARNGFSALPGVRTELEQVATSVNAEVIFDQAFTKEKLASEVDRISFPVLHLATHGQFSSNMAETFLLAWDEKITISDLDNLLRTRREQSEPIELMVLSACQTAEGDDRAALGLAGMAIRSGARSTLATLWSVNDSSTAALIAEFYQELTNAQLSKAEALRRAQVKILKTPKYSHPYYWSAFVLIGNWLS
ncbi:MAG: CHAT domain-containing protein [Cyanobacteria bacterium J06626_6]